MKEEKLKLNFKNCKSLVGLDQSKNHKSNVHYVNRQRLDHSSKLRDTIF